MTDTPENNPKTHNNRANDSEGYKIGYGKPPKHTQWKKGQRVNPKGRPKRGESEPYPDLFNRISNEDISAYENGRPICRRGHQLVARNIVDRGIAGDPECENTLIRIEQPDLTPPAAGLNIIDVDSEDEIAAHRELLRRKKRTNGGGPAARRFGRGRPRNDAPLPELVKRELNKRIKVQVNGRTVTITKREAWMRRLWNDVICAKPRALRLYFKLAKPTEPPGGIDFYIIGGR
jgi:hypothetical protein